MVGFLKDEEKCCKNRFIAMGKIPCETLSAWIFIVDIVDE